MNDLRKEIKIYNQSVIDLAWSLWDQNDKLAKRAFGRIYISGHQKQTSGDGSDIPGTCSSRVP